MTMPSHDGTPPSPDGTPVVEGVPWARQPSMPFQRATARARTIVSDLPAWDPMPPGEILVQRRRPE